MQAYSRSVPLELTYGIEEEFFLIDPVTRDLPSKIPPGFLRSCRMRLGERVGEELLQPQVEITTPILRNPREARDSLTGLRASLGELASLHGLGLVAAGTHPFAAWDAQLPTDKQRYARLIDEFQIVGRRNLLCGLHVHVGVPEGHDRVEVMNRLMRWLPVLLALSTSSPFWNGRDTGLMSYRQAAYDEWPRSGIPDAFANEAEYDAFIRVLASCGALRDGSFLWWAIRPSARFPTLELRIADACTHVDDALALAAAFRCLVRAHLCQPRLGTGSTAGTRRFIDENRWRAKRHGIDAEFIDEANGCANGFLSTLDEMLQLITPDARALGCEREMQHLRGMVVRGTSAQSQLAIYAEARKLCIDRSAALSRVVDWLARTTLDTGAATQPPCHQAAGDAAMA